MARKFQLDSNGKCTLATACVDPESLSPRSGDEIPLLRQRHLHVKGTNFGLAIGGTPVTAEYIIHVAAAAGVVTAFTALLNAAGSVTNLLFDLKKNGTSIVSGGTINITNATGSRVSVAGTISSPNYVAGDVFSIALTMTTNTGAQGPESQAVFDELAA